MILVILTNVTGARGGTTDSCPRTSPPSSVAWSRVGSSAAAAAVGAVEIGVGTGVAEVDRP
jgi:hypothetical protein